jgi:hypothetical protein
MQCSVPNGTQNAFRLFFYKGVAPMVQLVKLERYNLEPV